MGGSGSESGVTPVLTTLAGIYYIRLRKTKPGAADVYFFSFFFLYGILMEFLINLPQGASCTSPQGRDLPRFRVDECCTTFAYK